MKESGCEKLVALGGDAYTPRECTGGDAYTPSFHSPVNETGMNPWKKVVLKATLQNWKKISIIKLKPKAVGDITKIIFAQFKRLVKENNK